MPLLTEQDAALMDLIGLDPLPLKPDDKKPGPAYAGNIPACGCEFIDNWREWERALRLNLAKLRFIKTKREGVLPVEAPGSPADAVSVANKVINEGPMEGENLIDKARWNAIEALQGTDYFDRNTIFAYLLKIMILERQALFQTDTGYSEYKSLCDSILEQAGTLTAGEST